MSRIALVALYFPPIRQIGAKRPLRLANFLVSQGHDVTVFAVHPGTPELSNYAGSDPELGSTIDPRVRVSRTPSLHLVKIALRWRDRIRGRGQDAPPESTPASAEQAGQTAGTAPTPSVKERLSRLLDSCDVPDQFIGWVLLTLPVMLARCLLRRPDVIIVTAPPWSSLVLAVLVGRILGIPVHADFRDPWTLNPYVKYPSSSVKLERWVIRNSKSIIANTDVMAEDFRSAYPALRDRIHCVYNGYDHEMRRRIEALVEGTQRGERREFVVAHVGTLYPPRMPRELARVLAEVAATWTEHVPIRFRFVGTVWNRAPLIEEFAARGVSGALQLVGEVQSREALRETMAADVLLLLQLGTRQQMPAKVFEYAFARKPLVCFSDAGSETARMVSGYDLGDALDLGVSPGHLGAILARIVRGEGAPPVVSARFLDDFDGNRLAARMANLALGAGDLAL